MTIPINAHDSADMGTIFVAAIARQAWGEVAACLAEPVQFRALIPRGLRTAEDRDSAAGYFQKWFGDADQLVLLSAHIAPMHDRLHLTYRFRAHEDQWYIVEQQAYCTVQNGQITTIDLLCSGFRPEILQQPA